MAERQPPSSMAGSFGAEQNPNATVGPELLAELLVEVRALRRDLAATDRSESSGRLLTAAEKARELGRSVEWVRDHRHELGLVQLEGERPRLLFLPGVPTACSAGRPSGGSVEPAATGDLAAARLRRGGSGTQWRPIRAEGMG